VESSEHVLEATCKYSSHVQQESKTNGDVQVVLCAHWL